MRAWSRADPQAYRGLDIEAHEILANIPLHDVWKVSLPGGGPGRTVSDLRSLMGLSSLRQLNPAVRFLFGMRAWLGAVFGWDAPRSRSVASSFLERVPEEIRERSLERPGSSDGLFVLLYALEREAVSEARNATVHAFSVLVLEPDADGYRLFWAIYVAPVGRFTRFYMGAIDPFRRLVIYPAMLRQLRRSWIARYGEAPTAGPAAGLQG